MSKKKNLLVLGCLLATPAFSQALLNVDTLEVSTRTIYPPEVKTVGDAAEWLLDPLGYHIVADYPAPTSAKALLVKPIPTAAKIHRTMPITHALQLLIGEGNSIVVDREHQLISFSEGVL